MNKSIVIIICILLTHAGYNLINFLRFESIRKLFYGLFSNDTNIKEKSVSLKNQILNYMKYAGVSDSHIPVSQPIGYGRIATASVSVFDNIINNSEDIVFTAYELLLEAKGNYWSRFINTINPFYWLRIIIFIPKHIFSYLGLKEESIIIKIFQLIYWILAIVCTFLISVFPDEIKAIIFSLFNIS